MNNKKYKITGQLAENAGIYCACLAIVEDIINDNGKIRLSQPSNALRNGTITFVKTNDKVYGITCWHVVEHLRQLNLESQNINNYSFYTMVNGFYTILDNFIRPKSEHEYHPLDIGIRELNPSLLETIGKKAIDLDNQIDADEINFGYAIGFPESMKYRKMEPNSDFRVSMPQAEILAEISSKPENRFALFSELDEVPSQTDFSGMSGGPIFWCNEDNHGIYGIAYEAGTGGELTNDKAIFIYGELALPKTIKHWISQIK